MKTKRYLLAIFAALVLAGCYDDDKLWNAVNEQEQRIEALESWQKVVNNNIEAIQTLVSGKHYITEVTPSSWKERQWATPSPSMIANLSPSTTVRKANKETRASKVRQALPPSSASLSNPMGTGTGPSTAN